MEYEANNQEQIDFHSWYSAMCRQIFQSDDGCKETLNNLTTSFPENNFDDLLPDIDLTSRVTDCTVSTDDNYSV